MRFWPFSEQKVSAVATIHALLSTGDAVWSNRDYRLFATEGYQKNVVLFRCIFEIARNLASVPLLLWDTRREQEVENHPMMKVLRRPNPWQGGAAWREGHFSYRLIAGNAYIEAVGPGASPGSSSIPVPTKNFQPRELYNLRPDRMQVIPDKKGFPGAYEYNTGVAKRRFLSDPITGRSMILHTKAFHPTDDWYGLSPIEPGGRGIDQYNSADDWNMSLLQNMAVPSGALELQPVKSKDGSTVFPILDDVQFKKLSRRIDERMKGTGNARSPIFLEGGLKWIQMALTAVDLDFSNGRDAAARAICHSVGFPPQLLGIPGDNTYSNYKEARLALFELTVIPQLTLWIAEMNNWFTPFWGDEFQLRADWDQVDALAPRRLEVWDRIAKATWLTPNEKREATGYGSIGDAGDALLVPAGLLPIDFELPGANGDDSDSDPDDEDMMKFLLSEGFEVKEALKIVRAKAA